MSRSIIAMLAALSVWIASPLVLAAVPAGTAPAGAAGGLRVTLAAAGGAAKTGDHATITATVTNATREAVSGATLLLGLVDMTPGQPVPLGLETWTADPESVALPQLAPGASASATWHLVMIQPGPLGVYASVMAGPDGPIESSPVSILSIRDVRVLNPRNVLPVALGEPLVLVGLLIAIRSRRASGRAGHGDGD